MIQYNLIYLLTFFSLDILNNSRVPVANQRKKSNCEQLAWIRTTQAQLLVQQYIMIQSYLLVHSPLLIN